MNKKIRWITETAVMLALLVCLQALTKPMGQLVTGSCVNAVLAVSALVGGLGCSLVVALCSPVLAFLLGIACSLTKPAKMSPGRLLPGLLPLPRNSPLCTRPWCGSSAVCCPKASLPPAL